MVAKKYARAFLNLYGNTISLADCDVFAQAALFFKQYPRYVLILKLQHLTNATKKEMLARLVDAYALPDACHRLVDVLIKDQRLFLIPSIFEWIVDLYYADNNIEVFEAVSSQSLDESARAIFNDFLAQQTGNHIILKSRLQSDLIAGLKLQSDFHKWEYSIKQQLNSIKNFFSKG